MRRYSSRRSLSVSPWVTSASVEAMRGGRLANGSAIPLDQDGERVAAGLEDGVVGVAEVLAVGLQRHRAVAADDDPVEVVTAQDARVGAAKSRPPSKRASGVTRRGIDPA